MNATVLVEEGVSTQWPALATDVPMLATPGWLRAMEGRLGARPLTFVVREGGRAVLAAYASMQTAHRPGEFFDPHHVLIAPTADFPLTDSARAARAELAGSAPGPHEWLPSLVVMLPGYECVPVGPASTDGAALTALVSGVLRWAADAGVPTVTFLYTRPGQTELAATLRAAEFTELPLTYSWDLHLPGTGIDDYLAALPCKRRREAHREARTLAEAGVRVGVADVEPAFDDLVRLRCDLVAKYRGGADADRERSRLRTMIDVVAGGDPTLLLASVDGVPLGFALFAPHRDEWLCLAVGFDYSDSRSRLTYFGTAYYRAVETAYETGVTTIGYGQGAWQAKRARGCRPTLMTGWVHSTDPALGAAARASAAVTRLAALG